MVEMRGRKGGIERNTNFQTKTSDIKATSATECGVHTALLHPTPSVCL